MMKMYKTIPEAVEICKNTYKDRIYVMAEEKTGEQIRGTAYDIYSWVMGEELRGNDNWGLWPKDDIFDVEGCALMEVIIQSFCFTNPKFSWEREIVKLLNQIVAGTEDN